MNCNPTEHRRFAGKPKPRSSEPHFSELELVIMEKLFACPSRPAVIGGLAVVVAGLTAKELATLIGRPVGTIGPRLADMRAKGAVTVAKEHAVVNKRRESIWVTVL